MHLLMVLEKQSERHRLHLPDHGVIPAAASYILCICFLAMQVQNDQGCLSVSNNAIHRVLSLPINLVHSWGAGPIMDSPSQSARFEYFTASGDPRHCRQLHLTVFKLTCGWALPFLRLVNVAHMINCWPQRWDKCQQRATLHEHMKHT